VYELQNKCLTISHELGETKQIIDAHQNIYLQAQRSLIRIDPCNLSIILMGAHILYFFNIYASCDCVS
jgi:hypothetical protein